MDGMDEWQRRMNAAMQAGAVKVACKCGWEGMQSELHGQFTQGSDRYCPACRAAFTPLRSPLPRAPEPPGGE